MKPARFGWRMITYYLVFMVLSLILMFMVLSAPRVLQFVIMGGLLAGFGMILFNDGGVIGEKAVSMKELNEKRRQEGHNVDPENEKIAFHKKTALLAFLVATIPFLLLATVNVVYQPLYEGQVSAYEAQYGPIEAQVIKNPDPETLENGNPVYPADVSNAPLDENPSPPVNYVMVVTRILFVPYTVFLSSFEDNLTVYNLFLMLFSLVMPACGGIGYLNGPRFHKKKLDAIKKGVRSKIRKMKREKAKNQVKEPKREV